MQGQENTGRRFPR